MNKLVVISEHNGATPCEASTSTIWYTVIHKDSSWELVKKNPWDSHESSYEKRCYLVDDCVISFRPARLEDRIDHKEQNKGFYFVEIANQDASIIYTSSSIYTWEQTMALVTHFQGLSFSAATRVWKSKKL